MDFKCGFPKRLHLSFCKETGVFCLILHYLISETNKDFTSDYFNPINNKIQIDSLHENITIDAQAFDVEGVTIYDVTKNLLGCYTSNSDIKIQEDKAGIPENSIAILKDGIELYIPFDF